ncbi:MAG: DJ-1 family glyoxalase III [Anaerovoracaceae bacterium]|nr:DJ-1 family glyoxalase III [Anaerovoracaceae bacterium]
MVCLFIAEGFEEIEAVTICDVLRRGGVEIRTVSLGGKIVTGAHGMGLTTDMSIDDISEDACELAVLPGGMPGTTNLLEDSRVTDFITKMAGAEGKKVAAICAAPMVLGRLGILKDRRAVIYPGMEEELHCREVGSGNVCVDGDIITSKAPGTAMEFSLALLKELKGESAAEEVREGIVYAR